MTLPISRDVENCINAAVKSGRYTSADEMIAKLVQADAQHSQPSTDFQPLVETHKPIWEEIQELTADIPDDVWDALPTDLAEQHDHYIYGTPKRPTA